MTDNACIRQNRFCAVDLSAFLHWIGTKMASKCTEQWEWV